MIVRLETEGAVVQDADDCGGLHVETALDREHLAAALAATGTGAPAGHGGALLDLGVLRSRARLAATVPDWPQRWGVLVERLRREGRIVDDGRSVRVEVTRPGR